MIRWQMRVWTLIVLLITLLSGACRSGHDSQLSLVNDEPIVTPGDGAHVPVPGEPGLITGARLIPAANSAGPAPAKAAQAGVDFAANRFIAVFHPDPDPQSLAPYLADSGSADLITASDNAPLVDHTYFRKVSVNLGTTYGLHLVSRVFYKDVNFAVYQLPVIEDVAELDTMMLRLLNENPGLVAEVCYDMFVSTTGGPAADSQAWEDALRSNPAKLRDTSNANREVSIAAPDDLYYVNHDGDNDGDGLGTWGLWRMGATHTGAWDYSIGSPSVIVAVADTGVRYTHTDLVDNCINPPNDPPYNAPGILTDVINKDNSPLDGHGHGTFCAGQIGATGNNTIGLAGVCWDVTILPIKVLSDGGSGSDSQVAEGMLLADYLGANIISMSLGGPFPDRTTQLAAQQCEADGVLLIVAAGNDNDSNRHYPGAFPECLCVGATTLVNASDNQDFSLVADELPVASRYDARATFSNWGEWVDIAAPGVKSLSTYKDSDTAYAFGWQGTSMATPHVAGCAALLWSYIENPTHTKVRSLLQSSATEMTHHNNGANPTGFTGADTNGTVRFCNVYEAIQLYEDADYPWSAPVISWHTDNDQGDTLTGNFTVKVAVAPATGASIIKVDLETPVRYIGTESTPSGGYYEFAWDTVYEFNRDWKLTATAYDDKGNTATSTITISTSNLHSTLPLDEDFTGLADDAVPSTWYEFDGNQGGGNTSWGADPSTFGDLAPALHSSGTTANYGAYSNDWIVAPILDLATSAGASLELNRRLTVNSGDYAFGIATSDDRTFTLLFEDSNVDEAWTAKTYDLTKFGGQEVRLFWVLYANGSSHNTGLWLDDVTVAAPTGDAPSITINSPANGVSLNGQITFNVTVNEFTQKVKLVAIPPQLGNTIYTITDGTFNLTWDSRQTYNGGALFKLYAYDNADIDNLVAVDSRALTITNPTRDANWHEGFETITTLGGWSGSAFDGDWYTYSWGTSMWRLGTTGPHSGTQYAKMGPIGAGNYGDGEFDQLYSPVHDLSDTTHPYLRLWHQLDTGADADDYGKLILVRYDGVDDIESPLAEFRSDTSGGWNRLVYDLSAYKADPLRVNFLFRSDSGTAGSGWFIDDYEIIDANPQLTSLSPSRGQVGASVVINGSNFSSLQDDGVVEFAQDGGGTVEATVVSWTNTAITVDVPATASSGNVTVTVLGHTSAGSPFTVVLPAPVIEDLDQL